MKDFLLNQSLAVRTPVLPEVYKVIESIKVDFDSVQEYKTNIKEWLKPVINLSDYYVYPMNGITQGLDWWYHQENRSIYMDNGDYQWIVPRGNIYDDCIKYQSWPSAIDGNFRNLSINTLALDLAYVGSTKIQKIENTSNVERVFYSLSKSFGVRNIRTGWYFSKYKDKKLEDLTFSAKYYNYYAHSIAETIISNFDIDYVHKRLYNKQKDICSQLELNPSDSVWLATTTNKDYAKFARGGETARICLAGVYNEKT